MNWQKAWDFLTITAVIFLALGYFIGNTASGVTGKCFIAVGILAFIISIVGSSRTYKKHSYKCPICDSKIRPVGRWLPGGLGFNGTNAVVCPSCGSLIHIQDLKQN